MRSSTALESKLPRHVVVYAGASAVQGILSIALLPLATIVLGPADYGVYAYAMAVMAMAIAFSDPGCGAVLSRRKGELSDHDYRKLLATCLLASGGLGCASAILLALGWSSLSAIAGSDVSLSGMGMVLVCASIPMRAIIGTGTTMLILEARPTQVGIMLVAQAIASFAFTLYGIFALQIGADALLLGNAASAAAGMLCALLLLRARLGLPQMKWLFELARTMPSVISAALMDGLRPVIESAALARGGGIATLGIFSHSKMYYSYAMQMTNAFAYALWPRALAAAREEGDGFSLVRRAWQVAYLGLTVLGLMFAAYGPELIGLLTNGKFVDAAPWAAAWVAYLLIQNSGKPSTAVMFSAGEGARVMRLRAMTVFVAICLLAVMDPGLHLVVAIAFAEIIAFRILIALYSRKIRAVRNGDAWPFGGALLVGALTAIMQGFELEIVHRTVLLFLVLGCLIIVGRRVIADSLKGLDIVFARSSREGSV